MSKGLMKGRNARSAAKTMARSHGIRVSKPRSRATMRFQQESWEQFQARTMGLRTSKTEGN